MQYYIDGYNLLFRLLGTGIKLSEERQKLIEDLNHKADLLEIELTIVFDSQFQDSESSKSHFQHIEILFSARDETADELILEEVKAQKNPRQVTVVSSDKKLAWFARRCDAKTEAVEVFYAWLVKRCKNKLRQEKEFKAAPKKVPAKKPVAKKNPVLSTAPEECTAYYLEQFQQRYEKIAAAMPAPKPKTEPKSAKSKRKKNRKPPKNIEEPLSEMDRWENIFNTRLKEGGQKGP